MCVCALLTVYCDRHKIDESLKKVIKEFIKKDGFTLWCKVSGNTCSHVHDYMLCSYMCSARTFSFQYVYKLYMYIVCASTYLKLHALSYIMILYIVY